MTAAAAAAIIGTSPSRTGGCMQDVAHHPASAAVAAPLPQALFHDLARWRPWLPQAAALLDGRERARVARQQRPHDRDALTLAYACHRLALGHALGVAPGDVPLQRDARGKPVVRGIAMETSLSHAEGCVAVAICRAGPVGIDVEPMMRAAMMPSIAAHVVHRDEASAMDGLHAQALGPALLALWVRKEALLKAAGIGLVREMPEFEAPPGRRLPLPAVEGDSRPGSAHVHMLDVGRHWCAAIACRSAGAPAPVWMEPPAG